MEDELTIKTREFYKALAETDPNDSEQLNAFKIAKKELLEWVKNNIDNYWFIENCIEYDFNHKIMADFRLKI